MKPKKIKSITAWAVVAENEIEKDIMYNNALGYTIFSSKENAKRWISWHGDFKIIRVRITPCK